MRRLALLSIMVTFVAACDSAQTNAPEGDAAPAAGGENVAPLFVLENIDGDEIDVGGQASSDVIVLAFWATWCQPCQSELAKLNAVHDALSERGLRLYAVNIDQPDTLSNVGPWVAREGYRFEVLFDSDTQILTRYNPPGEIPYYVVLDASGKKLRDHQGYNPGDVGDLQSYLDGVLPN